MLARLASLLPRSLRRRLWLGQMGFDPATVEGVTFKIATTAWERLQAHELLHDAYVGRKIARRSATGLRVPLHALLPTTTVFVGVREGRVLGTISLVEDSPLGLPLEEAYPAELARLRGHTPGRYAEVGSLAVADEVRRRGVCLMLYNIMYRWAHRRRVDRLVIGVNPRIEDLYRSVLLFERFGAPRASYSEKLASAPVVALSHDMTTSRERFRAIYGSGPTDGDPVRNLYDFFVAREIEGLELPRGTAIPAWSEAALARFLGEHPVCLEGLTADEHARLARRLRRVANPTRPALAAAKLA